jgi:hypothetical protein
LVSRDYQAWVCSFTFVWCCGSAIVLGGRMKQNDINRYRTDTQGSGLRGTIMAMFNSYPKGATP